MMINSFMDMKEILPLTEFVQKVIDNTKYVDELKAEETDEANGRIENIEEFKSVVMEFMQNSEEKTLEEFLSSVSLVSDLDSIDEEDDFVTLMTLHSAKGLSFQLYF